MSDSHPQSLDAQRLKDALRPDQYLQCFEGLGFQFPSGTSGRSEVSNVLGPKVLGEGKTGSFSVNLEKGVVYDHGSSGYGGDLFQVVMDVRGSTFPEAVNWVSSYTGVLVSNPVPRTATVSAPPRYIPATRADLEAWTTALLSMVGEAARAYLYGRGLTDGTITQAKLGLRRDGASWALCVPHRLTPEGGSDHYKLFLFNSDFTDWKRNAKGKKVIRSLGKVARYELTDAFPATRKELIYCEGELDSLITAQHGWRVACDTHGAPTVAQDTIDWLAKQDQAVYLAFDNDSAGALGAEQRALLLGERNVETHRVVIPGDEGRDLNEVLLEGAEELVTLISAASPFPDQNAESAECDRWIPHPIELYPPGAAKAIGALAESMGCDPALIALPVLAVLAAAVGNTHRVKLKNSWVEKSTLWLSVIGESGTHKSPALGAAAHPVATLQSEALQEVQERKELFKDDVRQAPRYRISDSTLESAHAVHAENPRGLLLQRDELAGWMGSMGQYKRGDADLQGWIENYEGRPITIDRKSSNPPVLSIRHPAISVVGTIQPSVLGGLLTPRHFESGFAARILFAFPPSAPRRWRDVDVNQEVLDAYAQLVRRLYRIEFVGEPRVIPLDAAAKRLFIDFYNENAEVVEGSDGPLRAAYSKLEAIAPRIALIFAVCGDPEHNPSHVDGDSMINAIELTRWFRQEITRVYNLLGFGQTALDRDEALVAKLPSPCTWEDISEIWQVERRAAFNVINRLVAKGLLAKDAHGKYRPT